MKKNYFEIIIALIMLLFWLVPFGLISYGIDYVVAESIGLILIGVGVFSYLLFFKNTYFALVSIIFVPFIFSHPFDGYSIPICLFIAVGLALLGMILHLIRFKIKIKFPKLIIGYLAFSLTLILGGIGTGQQYLLQQLLVTLFACIGLLCLIIFFTSTIEKVSFKQICYLLTIFSMFIILQGIIAMFFNVKFDVSLLNGREVNVGWGRCNNIGVILLLTIAFPLYYLLNSNKTSCVVFGTLMPLCILTAIFIFLSKGSVLVGFIGMVIVYLYLLIYFIVKKQYKKLLTYLICIVSYIIFFAALCVVLYYQTNIIKAILCNISDANLDSLNGRMQIYQKALQQVKENWLFGKGLFGGYMFNADEGSNSFVWCHSTILQALYSGGVVGLIGMLYHLFEKYFYLIKKINFNKFILLVGFALSGGYGLIDVSYFFINYMVLFIIITILCDHVFTIKKEESVDESCN